MSDLYLSPRPQSLSIQSTSFPSSSSGFDSVKHDSEKGNHAHHDEIPPWEKLTFPNFHLEERTTSAVLGPGLGFAEAFRPKSRSRPGTPKLNLAKFSNRSRGTSLSSRPNSSSGIGIIPPFGRPRGLSTFHGTGNGRQGRPSTAPSPIMERTEEPKLHFEMLSPCLSVGSPGLRPPSPISVHRLPDGRRVLPHQSKGVSELAQPKSPPKAMLPLRQDQHMLETPRDAADGDNDLTITISNATTTRLSSCLTLVSQEDSAHGDLHHHPKSDKLENTPSEDEGRLHVTLLRPTLSINSQVSSRDCASFRGMLSPAFPPTPPPTQGSGDGGKEKGKVETLASLMNRSASSFLIWFPLTVSALPLVLAVSVRR